MTPRRFAQTTLCAAAVGCSGVSPPPPEPRPSAPSWRPASPLRGEVPRAGGEVVLDERDGLSPDEAAIFAVDQNPRLRAARAGRGLARSELLEAGVLPNPRLDVSIGVPLGGADAQVLGYGAGLSWNVSPLLARGARVSASRTNLASVDLEIAWQEWQVAQAARLRTVRAIYLERRVAVARELEGTWGQRRDALRQARAAGAVTELELTNAEGSIAEARVERLELERNLAVARVELAQALGIDPGRGVALDLSFAPRRASPAPRGVLEELPRRRLDLIALEHARRSHDAALRAATAARFPPLEIGLEARREVDTTTFAGATVSLALPFFDRNQGPVARERALRAQTDAEYDARLLEARADVLRATREISFLAEQLEAAREASAATARLGEQARAASVSGALSPLTAADILERAYRSRLRVLEVEQALAEVQLALAVASGLDAP